jgi:hypothetical protein
MPATRVADPRERCPLTSEQEVALPTTFGDEVAEQGWCTGAVIAHADVPVIAQHLLRPGGAQPTTVESRDWLVVVSQTCDVLAVKLEAEPFVEVLHCQPTAKLRSQFKELRSTRVLDFKPNRQTHDAVVLSAHAVADRFLLPREVLKDRAPDVHRRLSDVSTSRVLAWYSLRYGRPTWPDEFVARIGEAKTALEQALEPLKDDIAEVRVGIREKDEELRPDHAYHVAVYFVVDELTWDGDVDSRAVIYEAFAAFVSKLAACRGISVDQVLSKVVSGGEFRWQEVKATDLWNFANLSHRD